MSGSTGVQPLILVVDDDPGSLLLVESVLTQLGARVETAASAEAARTMVAGEMPDLLLLDIHLPGISGLTLAEQLKTNSLTAGIRIILLTGSTMPLHERAAMALGCQGLLTKPVSPAVLRDSVRAALDLPREERE